MGRKPAAVVYVRHPGDVVRAVLGVLVLAVCTALAGLMSLSSVEVGLFRAANAVPAWLYALLWLVMQFGSLAAAFVAAATAAALRRFRLAIELLTAGVTAYYLAVGLKLLIGRHRPGSLLPDVHRLDATAAIQGLGYPSGHAALSAALVATAVPFLPRRWRRVVWVIPVLVGFARVASGAHLPLDVVGGFALGYTVGALVHLVAKAPTGTVTAAQVESALDGAGIEGAHARPATVDARGSTPFFVTTDDGRQLFVKAVGADQRDADLLFKTYRALAFRDLGDDKPFRTAKSQIEVEALLDLFAARSGVRTPDVVAVAELPDGSTTLLCHEGLHASGLDTVDPAELTLAVVDDCWRQVARLHRARIAHRDLRLANLMLDEAGRVWLVDFGFATVSATDRALARDVAELLASQSTAAPTDIVVRAAVRRLGPDAVADAMPFLTEDGLAGATRTALSHQPGKLAELRGQASVVLGVALEPPVRFARFDVRTLFLLAAGLIFLGLVPDLVTGDRAGTVLESAHWAALAPTVLALAAVLPGLLEVMRGATGRPLASVRGLRIALAAGYASRCAPRALGLSVLDRAYLRLTGLSEAEAAASARGGAAAATLAHGGLLAVVALGLVAQPSSAAGVLATPFGALGALAVGLVAMALTWRLGGDDALRRPARAASAELLEMLGEPLRGVRVLGGAFVVTVASALAFVGVTSTLAPGVGALGVVLGYLVAVPVAATIPVPGGMLVLDVALLAALLADGVGLVPALLVVLLYRALKYLLVVLPGLAPYRGLRAEVAARG